MKEKIAGFLDELFDSIEELKEENRELRKKVQEQEERINHLNIPETTVNALISKTLNMHAQILLAVTKQQEQEE